MRKDNEVRDKNVEALSKEVGQLAADMSKRDPGKLPSDTTINPQHQQSSSRNSRNVQINQVSILRNGKVYDNKVGTPPQFVEGVVEDLGSDDSEDEQEFVELNKTPKPALEKEKNKNKSVLINNSNQVVEKGVEGNTIPFPAALIDPGKKKTVNKRGPQSDEMWEVFKQVKINLPLLDAIKQIPAYAKYLKDMCTQKRNHKIPKKLDMPADVSAIISGTLPEKLQDPGAPIISIQVGDFQMTRALLDLGASVSILPGSLYDQYEFGPLKKADTTVVLADLTPKLPRGVLTDVIVKVNEFYYPVDFLVLAYVFVDKTKQPTVILGIPFLATSDSQINCRTSTVDMTFGNRKMRLSVFGNVSNPNVSDECFMADIIDGRVPPYIPNDEGDESMVECALFGRLYSETVKELEEEDAKV